VSTGRFSLANSANQCAAPCTSPAAAASGLPCSRVSRRDNPSHVRHQSRRDGVQRVWRSAIVCRPSAGRLCGGRDGPDRAAAAWHRAALPAPLRAGFTTAMVSGLADRMTIDRHRVGRIANRSPCRLLEVTPQRHAKVRDHIEHFNIENEYSIV